MPRPQRPSADATREKILKAATKLFMQQGYAGTSMIQLAEKAQVNQTLIFHHFENKQKLWERVKSNLIAKIQAPPLSAEPATLKQFVKEAIEQRLAIYANCPELRKLVGWQKLESAKTKHQIADIPSHALSPSQWLKPLQHLQQIKQLKSNQDLTFIILWLVASVDVLIDDDLGYFKKNPEKREKYIKLLQDQFDV